MKTNLFFMAMLCSFLWVSCKNSKSTSYEAANISADSVKAGTAADTIAGPPKLVKTAEMHFKVKSVKQSSNDITALTSKFHGMVMHHSLQSHVEKMMDAAINSDSMMRVSSVGTDGHFIVKIPSANMDDFMNEVDRLAIYVDNRNMDIEDKTLDYLSSQLKIACRNQIIAQQKTRRIRIKNPADVIQLSDDLVDAQINNKRIDDAVKYSNVDLTFYQANTNLREALVNDDPSNYRTPFLSRLSGALNNGTYIFNETLITIANLWLFIAIGVTLWLIFRYQKNKA